jgi:flagellar motor switch protein FliN
MSPHPEPSAEVLQSFSDISVVVEAHFEEQMMDVHEVLAIRPGSVIPMKRAAGETLNVYVGNVYLATAEVIVIEDHLALRITQFGKFEA